MLVKCQKDGSSASAKLPLWMAINSLKINGLYSHIKTWNYYIYNVLYTFNIYLYTCIYIFTHKIKVFDN